MADLLYNRFLSSEDINQVVPKDDSHAFVWLQKDVTTGDVSWYAKDRNGTVSKISGSGGGEIHDLPYPVLPENIIGSTVSVPSKNGTVVGLTSPGNNYYPVEGGDMTFSEGNSVIDMKRYLAYENAAAIETGWFVWYVGYGGINNGNAPANVDLSNLSEKGEKRFFSFVGKKLMPETLTGTAVVANPSKCYEWNAEGTCTLNVDGWSADGEEWSTMYINVAEGAVIQGGTNLTLTGDITPGKINYCQLKGFKGAVRLYVLEVY